MQTFIRKVPGNLPEEILAGRLKYEEILLKMTLSSGEQLAYIIEAKAFSYIWNHITNPASEILELEEGKPIYIKQIKEIGINGNPHIRIT
jgi:hypothetical protein